MKISLYLMTKKGYMVLNALINADYQNILSEVVVGRDSNIENDFTNNIINLCKKNNIRYFERNDNYDISSNYSIAIAWRWIIPESTSKLIVLHDSLLPKYRGFAPLVNMLINKEPRIGVSALFASKEYDKGDIIIQSSTKINYPIKISEAIDLIIKNYTEIVLKLFKKLSEGIELDAVPQDEKHASYSLWRNEGDYLINWDEDSKSILNFINAVSYPYKGASSFINGMQKIRILEAELIDDVKIENRDCGKIIFIKNNFPVVVCGSGLLILKKIIDDKSKMNILPFNKFRIKLTGSNSH